MSGKKKCWNLLILLISGNFIFYSSKAATSNQASSKKILYLVKSKRDGRTMVIPKVSYRKYQSLSLRTLDGKRRKKTDIIEISWNSPYLDGRYRLQFGPLQAILISGHNNPNPPRLFWALNYSKLTFPRLKRRLKALKSKLFVKHGEGDYSFMGSKEEEAFTLYGNGKLSRKQFNEYSQKILRKNILTILSLLLGNDAKRVAIPRGNILSRGKLFITRD